MPALRIGLLLQSARPRQWTKNLLLFAAIVFAQKLGDPAAVADVLKVCAAFAAFCLLSSGLYLINDVLDLEQDRHHPVKSKRPVAAGLIGRGQAVAVGSVLIVAALAASFALQTSFGVVGLGYVVLQLLYSLWLKHAVILDVLSVAIGFVLRAIAGACVISVLFSHWLLLCTLFLALFLAVCKRRHELLSLGGVSHQHRKSLVHYSESMLDQMVAVVTSSTVIAYALYTVSPETVAKFGGDQLVYTVPFVLYGIFRYLYLVYRKDEGGSPEGLLFGDRPLLINIVLYGLTAAALVYCRR